LAIFLKTTLLCNIQFRALAGSLKRYRHDQPPSLLGANLLVKVIKE